MNPDEADEIRRKILEKEDREEVFKYSGKLGDIELRGDDKVIGVYNAAGTVMRSGSLSFAVSPPSFFIANPPDLEAELIRDGGSKMVSGQPILIWESRKEFPETGNVWEIRHFLLGDGQVEVIQYLNGEVKIKKRGSLWPAAWRGGWRTLWYSESGEMPEDAGYISTDVQEIEQLLEIVETQAEEVRKKWLASDKDFRTLIEVQDELIQRLIEHLGWRLSEQEK